RVSAEVRLQGDLHVAGQGLGDRAVVFGGLGRLLELVLSDVGDVGVETQHDLGDAGAGHESGRGLHVEARRGIAGLGEGVGEGHRVAGGVGGGYQLLGAGDPPVLFGPGLPVHFEGTGGAGVEADRAGTGEEVALPVGSGVAVETHVPSRSVSITSTR